MAAKLEHCVKNHLIWLRTVGEEAFGVTIPPNEYCE